MIWPVHFARSCELLWHWLTKNKTRVAFVLQKKKNYWQGLRGSALTALPFSYCSPSSASETASSTSILRGRRRLWGDLLGWHGLIVARGWGARCSCPVRGTRDRLRPPDADTGQWWGTAVLSHSPTTAMLSHHSETTWLEMRWRGYRHLKVIYVFLFHNKLSSLKIKHKRFQFWETDREQQKKNNKKITVFLISVPLGHKTASQTGRFIN